MDKLLALLAKAHYSHCEDEGDEEIALYFTIPDSEGGVEAFSVDIQLDAIKGLELKYADGVTPVDFSEIYDTYDRDSDGNEREEESEGEDDETA